MLGMKNIKRAIGNRIESGLKIVFKTKSSEYTDSEFTPTKPISLDDAINALNGGEKRYKRYNERFGR